MPDLLVHVAAARLIAAPVRRQMLVLLVLLGTCLPDFASKSLAIVVDCAPFADAPGHSAAGVLLLAYATSLFLEQALRPAAFLALFTGGIIHLALDLVRESGLGGFPVLLPFTYRCFEGGLFGPSDSLYAAPVAALVLAAFALRRRHVR